MITRHKRNGQLSGTELRGGGIWLEECEVFGGRHEEREMGRDQ